MGPAKELGAGASLVRLLCEVAKRLRDDEGNIVGWTCSDHWALWDEYPIGSYVRCEFRQEGGVTQMQRIEVLENGPSEHVAPPSATEEDEAIGERVPSDEMDTEDHDDGQLASLTRGVVDPSQEPQYEEEGDAEAREMISRLWTNRSKKGCRIAHRHLMPKGSRE